MTINYSVLLSIYYKENPDFFKKSIDSMLHQSLPPEEIVIVKDGELTDALNKIIDHYMILKPGLFTIIPLTENVGLGKALNEGLKKCRNDLVARMDTDDISLSERCELQVREFKKDSNLSIVGTMIDEFYTHPSEIVSSRIVPTIHSEILKFSRKRNPFNHPTVMYKKSAVLNSGGYSDYRRNQDLDLFVRMLNSGHKAMNINKSLLLFRANKDNLERRKSWEKTKSYIEMIYSFWRKGYSSFWDLMVVAFGQLLIFVAPVSFLEIISTNYLRKKVNKK